MWQSSLPLPIPHSDIQQCDSPVENLAALLRHAESVLGEDTSSLTMEHLSSWIPKNDAVAFWTPNANGYYDALTYKDLHEEIEKCPRFKVDTNHHRPYDKSIRVAIVMPLEEAAHTGTALLATMAQSNVTAFPVGPKILWDALKQLSCSVLVMSETMLMGETFERNDNSSITLSSAVDEKDVTFACENLKEIRVVYPCAGGRLTWTIYRRASDVENTWVIENNIDHQADSLVKTVKTATDKESTPVMLLRTSGTTAEPKVVPISRSHLYFAAKTIALTLHLNRNDCCLNAMPLFHIGGVACSLLAVLLSGGSVIFQGPFRDADAFLSHLSPKPECPTVTWYYASPTMHKTIALALQARPAPIQHKLRFIRSSAAHLPHDLAMELSVLLGCGVIIMYGMSEAIPISSTVPLSCDRLNDNTVDSVGYPVGCSVKIVNPETHSTLEYGHIGELCVRGAGVISSYENNKGGFTEDGWLLTGDLGTIDRQGRLFLKGRSKEMIKRGEEQVWPNQVDSVIQSVEGVSAVVTFGVPNTLYGEEVAAAVVACEGVDESQLLGKITETCRHSLEANAIPQQIKFVSSTDSLIRGSTGKYQRSKMAEHLGIEAVDTGTLQMLESATLLQSSKTAASLNGDALRDDYEGQYPTASDTRINPHSSLNGLRFFVSCSVVYGHVGLYPSLPWVRIQGYAPNMMIFFALGAFQAACSIGSPVKNQWARWVGTKIGSLHALFVISQFFTLPSTILFDCLDENGALTCEVGDYLVHLGLFSVATATGLLHGLDGNIFAWFQSVFYMFLIMFPFVDDFLRQRFLLPTVALIIAAGCLYTGSLYVVTGAVLPEETFEWFWKVSYTIIIWGPFLVSCVGAAMFFRRAVRRALAKKDLSGSSAMTASDSSGSSTFDIIPAESVSKDTLRWGWVCDFCSLALLVVWVLVAFYPHSLCLGRDTIEAMRGMDASDNANECFVPFEIDFAWVRDISYKEWITFVWPDPTYTGRLETTLGSLFGFWKSSCPLTSLWVFSMAFGNSLTSWIFGHELWNALAPLGYPVYLLHLAASRYYWLATRGLDRQFWWDEAGNFPFPFEWYEYFVILVITVALSLVVDRLLIPPFMPHTIRWGVAVCQAVSQQTKRVAHCLGYTLQEDFCCPEEEETPALIQVQSMVSGLTGMTVGPHTDLKTLGLDSLGTTALWGMLRASVPAAKHLTLAELQTCGTVGDLVNVLTPKGDEVVSL